MKNLKKLVSSVLAVALLAGSAVSLSCSAVEAKKDTINYYNNAVDIRCDGDFHPVNFEASMKALEEAEKLIESDTKLSKTAQQEELNKIYDAKRKLMYMKNLYKRGLWDKLRQKRIEFVESIKDTIASLFSLGLKVGAIGLIIGVCYLIGFENITKCFWALSAGVLKLSASIFCGIFKGSAEAFKFGYNCVLNSTNCTAGNYFLG